LDSAFVWFSIARQGTNRKYAKLRKSCPLVVEPDETAKGGNMRMEEHLEPVRARMPIEIKNPALIFRYWNHATTWLKKKSQKFCETIVCVYDIFINLQRFLVAIFKNQNLLPECLQTFPLGKKLRRVRVHVTS
jgi:hypothetical protein